MSQLVVLMGGLFRDKKVLLLSLITIALIVGAFITSFWVVGNKATIRNRAAEPLSCQPIYANCRVDCADLSSEAANSKFLVSVFKNIGGKRVPEEAIVSTEYSCSDAPRGPLVFSSPGVPVALQKDEFVECEIRQIHLNESCVAKSDKQTTQCVKAGGDEPSVTPQACTCSPEDGCVLVREDVNKKYDGKQGPGLIELSMKYPACFDCDYVSVKDASGREVRKYECGETVRYHQAQATACTTYKAELVGKDGTTRSCATCEKQVCCPACQPLEQLPTLRSTVPGFGCELPSGDSPGCTFEIVGGQCPLAGSTVQIRVRHRVSPGELVEHCLYTDKDDGSTGERKCFKTTKSEDIIEVPYPDAGVYDLKLQCRVGSIGSGTTDSLGGASEVSSDFECRQRMTVVCGGNTNPPTGSPTDPPSPTPAACLPLQPKLKIECPQIGSQKVCL
jgi:hypothetical protein